MGKDKIAAGILAQTAGVPSIPWSGDGLTAELTAEGTIPDETFKKACLNSVQDAVKCAERIGYPVMLKASEGGGQGSIRMFISLLAGCSWSTMASNTFLVASLFNLGRIWLFELLLSTCFGPPRFWFW